MIYEKVNIFEINARILLRRLNLPGILHVKTEYWQNLKELGMTHIWLMGVWNTSETSINKYCFAENLISEYKSALDDWKDDDVSGSPYAIEDYQVHSWVANSNNEIKRLKKKLNDMGLRLILDFIPNHFCSESKLLQSHPEIFLQGNIDLVHSDPKTFFRSPHNGNYIFAHGKDPYFDAWTDTAQLNYFSKETHRFMTERLIKVAELCDGVRCDMSMLMLKDVFDNTWGGALKTNNIADCPEEFWGNAISSAKSLYPEMIFIAEAYWNLEWQLQQEGFDFTYDKRLYDRLLTGEVMHIQEHLKADSSYQEKSLRFIENHDEQRAVISLGRERSKAAALIIGTVPGARLYFEGQFDGRRIKLPVQLGREPKEDADVELKQFYSTLLKLIKKQLIEKMEWFQILPVMAWEGNYSFQNMLSWILFNNSKQFLICVNYSGEKSQCKVEFIKPFESDEVLFSDLLSGKNYMRNSKELNEGGLFVELDAWKSHFFELT